MSLAPRRRSPPGRRWCVRDRNKIVVAAGAANEAYSLGAEEVGRARRLENAYVEAERQGLGAVAVEGDMVDVASIRILRNTIAKADLIGM